MTDWFRSWHGAPTDPKWLGIARKAGIAPGIAVAVAWALMDRASAAEDRGSISGYDADGLAYFFGCEPEQVVAIVEAMTEKGMISNGRFTSWERRQPKREDDSSERVRQHRERTKQQAKRDVTQRNAPEAEQIQSREELPLPASQQWTAARPKPAELSKMLFEAAGIAGFRDERHPRLQDLSPIYGLIDAGYDLRREILPVIEAKARNKTFSSWRFFCDAVVEASAANRAIPPKPQAQPDDWTSRLAAYREDGTWGAWGPKPGEPGCRVPPELMKAAA